MTEGVRRYGAEVLLVLLVWMSFFAGLGQMEVWGRREQRLAAEAADTVRGNWVIAYLVGKPRLEKPPLSRWLAALSAKATGRLDEFSLRLPFALGGAATVAMLYVWGRRMAGRAAGLTAGAVFCTFTLVVAEQRQASADALLVPLTTAALWALWEAESREVGRDRWLRLISGIFVGLGLLTKGPVALMIVLTAVAVYAWMVRRERSAWWRLRDPLWWGAAVATALPWPVLVLLSEPNAALVWLYEMGLKLGAVPEASEHRTWPMLFRLPEVTFPWVPFAIAALLLPWTHREETGTDRRFWLVWGWFVGNLVVFSCWKITKPSYFLPCLPAVALLAGLLWQAMAQAVDGIRSWRQKLLLASQWGLFTAAGVSLPVAAWILEPAWAPLALTVAALGGAGLALSIARRRQADSLVWLSLGHAALALAVFTVIIPTLNPRYSHRAIAKEAEQLRRELRAPLLAMPHAEESLWFYMSRPPRPVKGEEAVLRVVRRRGMALVLGDRRDFRRVQALAEVTVERVVDESQREGRKGMILMKVTPAPTEVADAGTRRR